MVIHPVREEDSLHVSGRTVRRHTGQSVQDQLRNAMERHPTPSAVLRAGSYRHSDISVNFTDVDVLHVGDTWWNGVYPFIDYSNRGGPEFGQASLLAISLSVALAALGLAMAIYLVSIREPPLIHIGNAQETSMTSTLDNGIATISGHQSVDQTVQKLEGVLAAKGVKRFAKRSIIVEKRRRSGYRCVLPNS